MHERLGAHPVVLMVLLTAIWGGSFTLVMLGLRDLPVFGSICLRFALAATILTVYCRVTGIPIWYTGRNARYLLAGAAAFSFVIFGWLIQHHSAIHVNAFVFLTPVFGVLIGWALLGEALSVSQLAGAFLVAAGILVVNTQSRSLSPLGRG